VYGVDGGYLGEIRSTEEGDDRLITCSYKKSRKAGGFGPTFERAKKRAVNRNWQPLYCGHEDFPSPEILSGTIATQEQTKIRHSGLSAARKAG
jgi:hypothetical protein